MDLGQRAPFKKRNSRLVGAARLDRRRGRSKAVRTPVNGTVDDVKEKGDAEDKRSDRERLCGEGSSPREVRRSAVRNVAAVSVSLQRGDCLTDGVPRPDNPAHCEAEAVHERERREREAETPAALGVPCQSRSFTDVPTVRQLSVVHL